MTWTLSLAEPHELPPRLPQPADAGDAMPSGRCCTGERTSGETVAAALFRRAALITGVRVTGPAVIVEDGTSTIVPTGYGAHIGGDGSIVIEEIEP